ncbi:hypothetical protein [Thermogemmatispora onikobensis]|uniref:hypothetical protein n=1 Tax=Thermogemmatispora onikobensis TaxID=732234 RepID=UPI00159F16DE|nr:hypothetical protein [Thermogemmatispora onikobensis]
MVDEIVGGEGEGADGQGEVVGPEGGEELAGGEGEGFQAEAPEAGAATQSAGW